jgi:hypothetical protein
MVPMTSTPSADRRSDRLAAANEWDVEAAAPRLPPALARVAFCHPADVAQDRGDAACPRPPPPSPEKDGRTFGPPPVEFWVPNRCFTDENCRYVHPASRFQKFFGKSRIISPPLRLPRSWSTASSLPPGSAIFSSRCASNAATQSAMPSMSSSLVNGAAWAQGQAGVRLLLAWGVLSLGAATSRLAGVRDGRGPRRPRPVVLRLGGHVHSGPWWFTVWLPSPGHARSPSSTIPPVGLIASQ